MKSKPSKTVLVIDDKVMVRATVARMLAREGHRSLQAANGLEGLNILDREKVDLILCDVIMPVKEGIETIREIRGKNPSIKIVAMSGGGRTNEASPFLDMALRLGADYSLSKPFIREELASLLQSCFGPGVRLPTISAAAQSQSPAISAATMQCNTEYLP